MTNQTDKNNNEKKKETKRLDLFEFFSYIYVKTQSLSYLVGQFCAQWIFDVANLKTPKNEWCQLPQSKRLHSDARWGQGNSFSCLSPLIATPILGDQQALWNLIPFLLVFCCLGYLTNSCTTFTDPRMFTEGTYKKVFAKNSFLINFNGFEQQVGYVDVEKIAEKHADIQDCDFFSSEGNGYYDFTEGFKEGFKTAQSSNEKKFSLEDLERVWVGNSMTLDRLKSLIYKPKTFDIEVEMENETFYTGDGLDSNPKMKPKIIKDQVKITKVSPITN